MRLKLIDKETGKPVTGADVRYLPIYSNPHAREVPGYAPVRGYRRIQLGHLAVRRNLPSGRLARPRRRVCPHGRRPVPAGLRRSRGVLQGRKAKKPSKGSSQASTATQNTIFIAHGDGVAATHLNPSSVRSSWSIPAEDSVPLTAEAVLERDRKREVHVVGPDGEPLSRT